MEEGHQPASLPLAFSLSLPQILNFPQHTLYQHNWETFSQLSLGAKLGHSFLSLEITNSRVPEDEVMGASLYLETNIWLFQHLHAPSFSMSLDNPVWTKWLPPHPTPHSVNIYFQHLPDFPLMCLHPIRVSMLSNFVSVLFLFLPLYSF